MPSHSEKQRKFIYAIRNRYKKKKDTPKKWKWVWNDEWLKVQESVLTFNEFIKKNPLK